MTDTFHARTLQTDETKESFRQALFLLLQDQQLTDIKVAHLAQKAAYARRTFYRHYQTLDDVVKEELDRLPHELFTEFSYIPSNSFAQMTEVFFGFWEKYQQVLEILLKNQIFHWLQASWSHLIHEAPLLDKRHFHHYYQQQFAIGAMFYLLQAWSIMGFHESPLQMRGVALSIIKELSTEKES